MIQSDHRPVERPVFQLSYVSKAAQSFSDAELEAIAAQAKRNNTRRGLSGMLIACADEFMQILEGPEAEVMALYAVIAADPRHANVTIVSTDRVEHRAFGDWSMGCFALQPEDLPDGFLFRKADDGDRLRADALKRIEDLVATFRREHQAGGGAEGFASLVAA